MSLLTLPSSGMNLQAQQRYTTGLAFANACLHANWGSLGGTGSMTLNAYNELLTVPSLGARKWCFGQNGNKYPTGEYLLRWKGDADVDLIAEPTAHTLTDSGFDGTYNWATYDVAVNTNDGIKVRVMNMNASDPARDVGLFPPYAGTTTSDTFRAAFKSDMSQHKLLRFLDWGATNNSTQEDWSDRISPLNTYWGDEIPYEIMIQLANETDSDPWFCIPHLATDDYVESLAELILSNLDSDRKVYIEYSNEVWNFAFTQAVYANTTLVTNYSAIYPTEPLTANWCFCAGLRAGEMFDIFRSVLPSSRVVAVVAGQAGYSFPLTRFLQGSAKATGTQKADVAAVAPYFALDTAVQDALYADYLTDTVDEAALFDDVDAYIDDFFSFVQDNKDVADSYSMPLIAYEGGQHFRSRTAYENDAGYVQLLADLQQHARMGLAYERLLDGWYALGGLTFVQYNDISIDSKSGYWGLRTSYDHVGAVKYDTFEGYYGTFADTVDNPFVPEITSSASLPIDERTTSVTGITTSGRGPVVLEIVGGADEDYFEIVGGSLKFKSARNYIPAGDNNYEVAIAPVGYYGTGQSQTLNVEVVNVAVFPDEWAGWDTVTLPNPTSAVTDFPYAIQLGSMSATWWANVASDGRDIRVTKGDGTTELPFVVRNFAAGSPGSGVLHFEYTGTKASSGTEQVYIFAGCSAATMPAVGDANGQYAAVSAMRGFWPDGGGNDLTSNANNFTMTGSPTVAGGTGPIAGSKSTDYNGTSQHGLATASIGSAAPLTLLASGNPDAVATSMELLQIGPGPSTNTYIACNLNSTVPRLISSVSGSAVTATSGSASAGSWNHFGAVEASSTSRTMYDDGTAGTPNTTSSPVTSLTNLYVAARGGSTARFDGKLSFLAYFDSALSAAFIAHWAAMLATSTQSGFYTYGSWTDTPEPTGGNSYTSPGMGIGIGMGIGR